MCRAKAAEADADAREAKCDAIGGTLRTQTCGQLLECGFVKAIASKDQCSVINKMTGQPGALGIQILGSKCCAGKPINPICGDPAAKVCAVDGGFQPDASSFFPVGPGEAVPTCAQALAFLSSVLPEEASQCNDTIADSGGMTKSGVLMFTAYHCCKTRTRATNTTKTVGGRACVYMCSLEP